MSVDNSNTLRDLQDKYQEVISNFYVNLGQNKNLYLHYKVIENNQYTSLNLEQQKIIDNSLKDFLLNGIDLDSKSQEVLKNVQTKLDKASNQFEQNVLDATANYEKLVTLTDLNGLPENHITLFKCSDTEYKITLQAPSYIAIMQYAKNRALREELYFQYNTRASEFDNWNNTNLISEIINLRQQKATILSFSDYVEFSLATKMANSTAEVLNFLYDLASRSHKKATADFNELEQFARTTENIESLQAWDIAYFSEKLRQQKYSYSTEELRQYFQLPYVLQGLFTLINKLFLVTFNQEYNIHTWNDKVTTYSVIKDNKIIGYLYLDLFARENKHSGAWMNSAQDKNIDLLPQAYIICNFMPPVNNQVLLNFDDLETLFHEMGHALHHMLTNINYAPISGTNSVEWDAVELPSQFMELFLWNYEVLSLLSKHVNSEKTLPIELFNKLLKARFFNSGMHTLRQVEFAIFDILIHTKTNKYDADKLIKDIRQKVAVIPYPEYNRFANSFTHIFSGGYAAGYYSYKWAEILAADSFSRFEGKGLDQLNSMGTDFYKNILAMGGLRPMLENFESFMGRAPKIDALLKYSGID